MYSGIFSQKGKLTLSLEVGRDACAGVEELQLESRMEKLRSVSPKSREPKGLPPGAPRKPLQLPLGALLSSRALAYRSSLCAQRAPRLYWEPGASVPAIFLTVNGGASAPQKRWGKIAKSEQTTATTTAAIKQLTEQMWEKFFGAKFGGFSG